MSVLLRSATIGLLICVQTPFLFSTAQAQSAKKLLERMAGAKVPADHPLLAKVQERLNVGDRVGAAQAAQEHPNFYNITVKQMALKMSTRELTIAIPLNDFAASFIGVTRDDLDARLLLTGNFHYKASPGTVPIDDITRNNSHYDELEKQSGERKMNLGEVLKRVDGQVLASMVDGEVVANPDPAGVLTSRAFLGAHAIAGTNRRPVEYTMKEFMCVDMPDWSDTGSSDARVGQDIDRLPAGDHLRFLTTCKGCHTGMDGFRGAFAKWDWQEDNNNRYLINSAVHTDFGRYNKFITGGISRKMVGNATVYPSGYRINDSSWMNFARGPANAALFGWRGTPATVNGGANVKGFAELISNSKRFSQCMVKRVFEGVCRKDLNINQNVSYVESMAQQFELNSYKLKDLFQRIVLSTECGQ